MYDEIPVTELFQNAQQYFVPAVSVDNVIFGFHEDELRVLLLHMTANNLWALPGGYVFKEEEIDDAAVRILKKRTNLQNLVFTAILYIWRHRADKDRSRTEVF